MGGNPTPFGRWCLSFEFSLYLWQILNMTLGTTVGLCQLYRLTDSVI